MLGIYAELSEGKFKKAILETGSYASQLNQGGVTAICVGQPNAGEAENLSKYGINKLIIIDGLSSFDSQVYAQNISQVVKNQGIKTFIVANTYEGKSISSRIAISMNASLATNVIALPDLSNGFSVKRSVFSGKGFAFVQLNNDYKVLALTPNSIEIKEFPSSIATETVAATATQSKTEVTGTHKAAGKIPLTEAEVVVSAGRGLKGPENWGMVEELAGLLGAATACSKPVSDMGWRPHSEHVGQTGITIKPNLYIAIGISGAIQHLAGVSSSKVIVAINKDPEAPFFKAADFGIVGDAFEILPKIIEAAKH